MKKKTLNTIVNILMVFVIIAFSAYAVLNSITGRVIVSGSSMFPTLENLDYGMMNVSNIKKKNIKRFDIVVFDASSNGYNDVFIKRVIGLPNDKIVINEVTGELTVNDKIVVQNYLSADILRKTCTSANFKVACGKEFIVPEGEFYVLGDNRNNSTDSEHGLGTVPHESILGILWYVDSKCGSIETNIDKNGNKTYACKDKKRTEIRFF